MKEFTDFAVVTSKKQEKNKQPIKLTMFYYYNTSTSSFLPNKDYAFSLDAQES